MIDNMLLALSFVLIGIGIIGGLTVNKPKKHQGIKTEYCIELVDTTGLCKLHSHFTDSIYTIHIDDVVEAIDLENL